MAKPLPPRVYGPLRPGSIQVRCDALLPGAVAQILVNHEVTNEGPLHFGWIDIGKPVSIGQKVTARQVLNGDASEESPDAVLVEAPLDPLPAPEFTSVINQYSTLLTMDRLAIGAQLEIQRSSDNAVIYSKPITRSYAHIRIDPSIDIFTSRHLLARQSFGGAFSETRRSPMLVDGQIVVREKELDTPQIFPPLTACRTNLRLVAAPGFELTVHNEDRATSWLVPGWDPFDVANCQLLVEGKAYATLVAERLGLSRDGPELRVEPAEAPAAAELLTPYCPNVGTVVGTNLAPGATIVFEHRPDGGNWTAIGLAAVQSETQEFDLPAAYFQGPAQGRLRAIQERCGEIGPPSDERPITPLATQNTARIQEPIFACSTFVKVTNVSIGAKIVILDEDKAPISHPKTATASAEWVDLTRPLRAGETIGGSTTFCDGDLPIDWVDVQAAADVRNLGLLPIKPSDNDLRFENCVPGIRIDIHRNDIHLGYFYPRQAEARYRLPYQARLQETFSFFASQCGDHLTKGAVVVEYGRLSVRVVPETIYSNERNTVRVEAHDAFDGAEVNGGVILSGSGSAIAGANHSFNIDNPPETPSEIEGAVFHPSYVEGKFTIRVRKRPEPTPPPVQPTVRASLRRADPNNFEINPVQVDVILSITASNLDNNSAVRVKGRFPVVDYGNIVGGKPSVGSTELPLYSETADGSSSSPEVSLTLVLQYPWEGRMEFLSQEGFVAIVETGSGQALKRYSGAVNTNENVTLTRE